MEMYELTGPTFSGPFTCCNFMHYLFRKVFCNILIQKFQKVTVVTVPKQGI